MTLKRSYAFLFALTGVILLLGVSFSISLRNGWLALAFGVAAILEIGVGFMMKARARRQSANPSKE